MWNMQPMQKPQTLNLIFKGKDTQRQYTNVNNFLIFTTFTPGILLS